MRVLSTIFALTMSFSAKAQVDQPVLQQLNRSTAFQNLNPRAATALDAYFADISSLSEGLFLSHPSLGFAPFHCTQMIESQKPDNCSAILCRDAELYERLQNELRGKRLILMTHAFNPFNGVALNDTPAVIKLKGNFPAIDPKKNALIVSPNLNLYSFEHELVHTRDFESGILSKFSNELSELLKAQKISRPLALAARNLVREVRAYDIERRLLLSPRSREYQLNVPKAQATMEIEVQEVSGAAFSLTQLALVDQQVKGALVPQFAQSIAGVDDASRQLLLEKMGELLPTDGPYSLKNLGF